MRNQSYVKRPTEQRGGRPDAIMSALIAADARRHELAAEMQAEENARYKAERAIQRLTPRAKTELAAIRSIPQTHAGADAKPNARDTAFIERDAQALFGHESGAPRRAVGLRERAGTELRLWARELGIAFRRLPSVRAGVILTGLGVVGIAALPVVGVAVAPWVPALIGTGFGGINTYLARRNALELRKTPLEKCTRREIRARLFYSEARGAKLERDLGIERRERVAVANTATGVAVFIDKCENLLHPPREGSRLRRLMHADRGRETEVSRLTEQGIGIDPEPDFDGVSHFDPPNAHHYDRAERIAAQQNEGVVDTTRRLFLLPPAGKDL